MKRLVRPCSVALSVAALSIFLGGLATATASAEPYVYQGGNIEESPGHLFVGDGEEFQELPFYGSSPSLAPDGKRIAFFDNELNVAITDLDGHGPHVILPSSVELYAGLEWAPDGSELIASSAAVASDGTIVSLHPSSTSTEWEEKTVLAFSGGAAFEPTISPDGSKIAFASYHDATGKALGNPAIFIANRNGTGVEQLTSPPAYAGLNPSFSPDGKKIAFDGLAEKAEHTDIFSINVETKTVTDLTNTSSFEETGADYLSNGRIAYSNGVTGFSIMDANGENKESLRTFSGKETWYRSSWPQIQGDLPTLGPETKEEATKLLHRYSPKLRDDSGEAFLQMSWKPITEIYSGKKAKESNSLIRSTAEKSAVIAYANPALSTPNLNWSFLKPSGGKYPNEKSVSGGDRLSERTSSEEGAFSDIALKEVLPEYKERTYGRVKYAGGRWWLQYWLWSYYQSFLPKMIGDHEGDWEMIQIGLNEDGLPELATYAEHSGGESCKFSELDTSIGYYGNLAPDVFVSWGVHASYTSAGAVPSPEFTDAEVPIPAKVEEMNDTENWVQWPGTWGDSESSPGAPSTQGNKWTAPDKFYEEGDECGASLRAARATQNAQKNPAPEVSAERVGESVEVSYHWASNVQPQPASILVSISEPGGTPFSRNILVHGNSGQVKIDNPFDGAKLIASVRTIAPGVESAIAETPVR